MEIEKGVIYILTTTILITIGIYITYKTIFSSKIEEQRILLIFMFIVTVLITYIRKCTERDIRNGQRN